MTAILCPQKSELFFDVTDDTWVDYRNIWSCTRFQSSHSTNFCTCPQPWGTMSCRGYQPYELMTLIIIMEIMTILIDKIVLLRPNHMQLLYKYAFII